MNATRRTSLVAFLAMIALGVMTGCSSSTPGTANPAATTAPSVSASVSPTQEFATVPPRQAESATTPSSVDQPSTQEPSTQEPSTPDSGPAVRPTDLSGTVYGFIRGVDVAQSEVTLDKVDWFSGTDAEQACAVDKVSNEERLNGWCDIYYYRNVNPALRVVSVSPDVAIVRLEGTAPVSEDLQSLADRVGSAGGEHHPYRIIVTDGAIVELTQSYQP